MSSRFFDAGHADCLAGLPPSPPAVPFFADEYRQGFSAALREHGAEHDAELAAELGWLHAAEAGTEESRYEEDLSRLAESYGHPGRP